MKTTTFYINKSNNSNNFHSTKGLTDYSKILDAIITSNVKAKNPYLFGEDTGWDGFDYSSKKKPITIDITLKNKKKSCAGCPLKGMCKSYSYDIDTFTDAIEFLANYKGKDDYDFKLSDGTPVKFFGDGSIQIGYELFFPNNITSIFDTIDEPKKKSIIDIYIDLK